MDSRRKHETLSSLPERFLVLIISFLPFKDALKTSILSKQWRSLCYQTTSISFKEDEFVKCCLTSDDQENKKASFFRYAVDWMTKFKGETIKTFELCTSSPVGFETNIESLIEFTVSKRVKNLVLDFSNPGWISGDDQALEEASMFHLPRCVYYATTLESLKLFGCVFEPSRLADPSYMKCLEFGWIQLGEIMSLISRSPLLSSLSIKNCWNVDLQMIDADNYRWLRELIIENCEFAMEYSTLNLPNIQVFKYYGEFHYFQFMEVNRNMKEANLDFGAATEYDEDTTGTLLCRLLYDLLSAKKLTICPFLIQLIQSSDDPIQLEAPMETRHLLMKTNLHPNEFIGIRLMINSCPDLETLTFVMVPPRPVLATEYVKDPDEYWTMEITHECLNKTLKIVEVRNFSGSLRELQVLQYLLQRGLVLERVDLYFSSQLKEDSQKILARAAAGLIITKFRKASNHVRINQYTD